MEQWKGWLFIWVLTSVKLTPIQYSLPWGRHFFLSVWGWGAWSPMAVTFLKKKISRLPPFMWWSSIPSLPCWWGWLYSRRCSQWDSSRQRDPVWYSVYCRWFSLACPWATWFLLSFLRFLRLRRLPRVSPYWKWSSPTSSIKGDGRAKKLWSSSVWSSSLSGYPAVCHLVSWQNGNSWAWPSSTMSTILLPTIFCLWEEC